MNFETTREFIENNLEMPQTYKGTGLALITKYHAVHYIKNVAIIREALGEHETFFLL